MLISEVHAFLPLIHPRSQLDPVSFWVAVATRVMLVFCDCQQLGFGLSLLQKHVCVEIVTSCYHEYSYPFSFSQQYITAIATMIHRAPLVIKQGAVQVRIM